MATVKNLTIYRGDTKSYRLNITDGTNPIDITNYTFFLTVKSNNDITDNDNNALISKTVTTHTDPTGGITDINLNSTDTNINSNTYKYDIQMKTNTQEISTILIGSFIVLSDVTKRTS